MTPEPGNLKTIKRLLYEAQQAYSKEENPEAKARLKDALDLRQEQFDRYVAEHPDPDEAEHRSQPFFGAPHK
jgi:hypothetical protein